MSQFIKITPTHGWIGRIGWWNTIDQPWLIPAPDLPPPPRIWGHAPIWCSGGWGPPSNWRTPTP
jgi:hypothetical protein